MPAKVILNPYSARWQGGERQAEIEAALRAAGIEFDIDPTTGPGHASELASKAVEQGFSPIIGAGGDGTLSEVINGMLAGDAEGEVPFGMMPVGTANDLADNLGWPKKLAEAARLIAAGRTRRMDVCEVNGRYFVNNAGLGLEPFVSTIQASMTRLRGNLRYMVAALQGIMANPQWQMSLEWDEGNYEGPATLVSIGNCARTGGIFFTVPHADPFDGKLSFILGHIPKRLGILRAFPMIMKPAEGNISEHPDVQEFHTTQLRVRTQPTTPYHADGEVIAEAESSFEFRIQPGRLPIIVTG